MRIELCDCENVLLREIVDPAMKRRDVALTYGLALVSSEKLDWAKINRAIMDRWSQNALLWIKKQAWKITEGKAI